jgi:hypothetical protein
MLPRSLIATLCLSVPKGECASRPEGEAPLLLTHPPRRCPSCRGPLAVSSPAADHSLQESGGTSVDEKTMRASQKKRKGGVEKWERLTSLWRQAVESRECACRFNVFTLHHARRRASIHELLSGRPKKHVDGRPSPTMTRNQIARTPLVRAIRTLTLFKRGARE